MSNFRVLKMALAALAVFMSSFASHAAQTPVHDQTIRAGGQTFRYLSAGTSGPAIVLLHGWPQSADEFREIMPILARTHIVYAPDLSGIGGTTAPLQDWRKETLASDVKRFVDALQLEKPLLVGHDIGGMVAYAYARQFQNQLSGVVILDVPIPGLAPWFDIKKSGYAWHFDFHKQKGLAESLVQGKQSAYFRYFINLNGANPDAVSDSEVAIYAQAYGSSGQLRAGFELYRAFDADAAFFTSQTKCFDLPMLVVGGEHSMKATLPVMAESFAAVGVKNLITVNIAGSGHWLAEEQPVATALAILTFAASIAKQPPEAHRICNKSL